MQDNLHEYYTLMISTPIKCIYLSICLRTAVQHKYNHLNIQVDGYTTTAIICLIYEDKILIE